MGYECGFCAVDKRITHVYKLKKFSNESLLLSDFIYESEKEIDRAIEDNNRWEGCEPSTLKDFYHKDEYGYDNITKDYDFWCSIGRYITDFLVSKGIIKKNNGFYHIIIRDDLINLLCELNKKYFNYENVKHYDIANGIIEDDEDESQKLIPIDGIELLNVETNEYHRILSCECCTDFQYLDMSDDIDGVFASLIRCVCNILQNNDFDSYDILFWESY